LNRVLSHIGIESEEESFLRVVRLILYLWNIKNSDNSHFVLFLSSEFIEKEEANKVINYLFRESNRNLTLAKGMSKLRDIYREGYDKICIVSENYQTQNDFFQVYDDSTFCSISE